MDTRFIGIMTEPYTLRKLKNGELQFSQGYSTPKQLEGAERKKILQQITDGWFVNIKTGEQYFGAQDQVIKDNNLDLSEIRTALGGFLYGIWFFENLSDEQKIEFDARIYNVTIEDENNGKTMKELYGSLFDFDEKSIFNYGLPKNTEMGE